MPGKKRSKSSQSWLKQHFSDQYVKQAQAKGYRSRAVFKLMEIQQKDAFIRPGMTVVDLGAAPGGWSQLAEEWVGRKGKVFALDLLEIKPMSDVYIIQGDFTEDAVLEELMGALEGARVDVVLSDMAPNMSGMKAVDQPRAMYLAELAVDFALKTLGPRGVYLVKLFHGEGFDEYVKTIRTHFKSVIIRKPDASRPGSREVYLLAQGLKPS